MQKIQKLLPVKEPALFVEEAKKIMQFMPRSIITKFINKPEGREFYFESGEVMLVTTSNKKIGTHIGDVCAICNIGEVVDAGGCATCSRCGAQLKCGL